MRIPARGSHRRVLKERPDIGTTAATGFAGELGLQIRQSDIIAPGSSIDHDRVGAFEISALNPG